MSSKIIERRESFMLGRDGESTENLEDSTDDENATLCGIGEFRPPWLQKFNSPKLFLANTGILGLLNGATWSYFIGCISTLEKRYAFETQIAGIILASEDICPLCFGFLISYFSRRMHRPKFMAMGMLLSSISSFLMASPYLIYGPIRETSGLDIYSNVTEFELCDMAEKEYVCHTNPTIGAVTIFFIGLVMKGCGNVAFYIVGTPYLDDNIKKKNTAIYFAILMVTQLLGPACGFSLASLCLQFYENPFDDPGYGPEDPRWIGAWWLGFVIIGVSMFVISIPVWLYPQRFPGRKLPKGLEKVKDEPKKTVLGHLKEMKTILLRLYKNKILICHQMGSIMRINGIEGFFILMPKYVEQQFRQSASKANLLTGPLVIFVMQCGIIIGGVSISKFLPRARVLTGGIVVAQSLMVISLVIGMQITCPSYQMTGTSSTATSEFNLENTCNHDCLCTTKEYTPVCGPDKTSTYFSPCYAGCTGYNETGEQKIYTDCKCVHDNNGIVTTGDAHGGYCGFECQSLIAYIVIIGLGKFIFATLGVADALVTLRCVDPGDKSLALGAVSALYSVLAFFPYPLIYGALTDSSCLVWEKSCGKTGNCWIYDTDQLRYRLHGTSAFFLTIGIFFDIVVCVLSPKLKNLYEEGEETEGKEPSNTVDGTELAQRSDFGSESEDNGNAATSVENKPIVKSN